MDAIKYALIALTGWGFWAIGSKIMTRHLNTVSTSFWISFWALIFLSTYVLFKRNLMINRHILYAIPVGFISLVALLAFYKALRIGPASVVVPLANMYLLFPVLYGFIILGEEIKTTRILGIICAGLATILLSL